MRRKLIVTAGAAVMAAILAACGGSSGGSSSSGAGAKPTGNGPIVFQGPGGAIGDVLKSEIAAFTKSTGVKVTYSEGTTSVNFAKVLAEKSDPQISVANINPEDAARGAAQGLLLPINAKLVPNYKFTYPYLDKISGPDSAPGTVTAEGLAYNTKEFAQAGIPPLTSLGDLTNPKLKGHVALSPPNGNFGIDMLVIETLANGGNLTKVAPGFTALKTLKSDGNWALTPQATADNDAMMAQGTAWVQYSSTTHVDTLAAQGVPVKFVYPKPTGGVMELSNFAVVKGAPNTASAYKLINWLLSAQSQEAGAKAFVGPVTTNAKLSAAVAKNVPYGLKQIQGLYQPNVKQLAELSPQWVTEWNQQLGS